MICPHCQQPIPEDNEKSWPSWEQFLALVPWTPRSGLRVRLLNSLDLFRHYLPNGTTEQAFGKKQLLSIRNTGVRTLDFAMNLILKWRRRS